MPGNIVTINNAEELNWYFGDSQMEDLIKYLDKHGYRDAITEDEKTLTIPSKGPGTEK